MNGRLRWWGSQGDLTSAASFDASGRVSHATSGYTAGVVISPRTIHSKTTAQVFSVRREFTEAPKTGRGHRRRRSVDAASCGGHKFGRSPPVRLRSLLEILPSALRPKQLRIVVDCGNGATTTVAPRVFEELGLQALCIGCEPDGRNINLGCGSTAPQLLARTVASSGSDLGIAYDGDGDRAIFVDANGSIVDGDAVMLMCAQQMKAEGRLKGGAIVATVMSNIGLEIALREAGIGLVRCQVSDNTLWKEAASVVRAWREHSGHVIFSDMLPVTAWHVALVLQHCGHRPHAGGSRRSDGVPQVLLNSGCTEGDLTTIPQWLR